MTYRAFKVGLLFWCLSLLLPIAVAHGATITLIAFSTFALALENGNPLPQGSIVEIIGSGDNVQDGHVPYGSGFIWGSTQNDDIILTTTTVDSDGQFFVSTSYDDTVVTNLYIRFYDTTVVPSNGQEVAWGTSIVFDAVSFFQVQFQNFTPSGTNFVSQTNQFYVIPEPGSFSLLAFMGLLIAGFRYKWLRAWWRQAVAESS